MAEINAVREMNGFGQMIADNVARVRAAIAAAATAAGRQPEDVALMAVTKTRTAEEVRIVVAAGVHLLGENRVQEAETKIGELAGAGVACHWHLIGHLQRNKAARAVRLFDVIQSVDSVRLVDELETRARELGKILPVFLEVNTGGEETKTGASAEAFEPLAERAAAATHLRVEGLMTVGPMTAAVGISAAFRSLRRRFETYQGVFGPAFNQLSMGMTDDFEIAIAEGSTLVRVGRAIFGPR